MESAVPLRLSFSELITTPSPCLDNEYTQQSFFYGDGHKFNREDFFVS